MAIMQVNFKSELEVHWNLTTNIILPLSSGGEQPLSGLKQEDYDKDHKLPVLWLLHGYGGDCSDWLRFTEVESFAVQKKLIVVCPSAMNYFYSNMGIGAKWLDIITYELWDMVHAMLPAASSKREDNFIAGLGMGGHGALKMGFTCPEKYSALASLSGDVEAAQEFASGKLPVRAESSFAIFGSPEQVIGGKDDLYHLSKELKENKKTLPKIYLACGKGDSGYQKNLRFRDWMTGLGYDTNWDESGHGHEWAFWNQQIKKFIDWLQI